MNATVELIAATTKIASKIGVGTIVSGVIENAVNVEELSAFRKTCCAVASITLTGAVTRAADKYVDATAEKASKFIEDVKTEMNTLKEKKSEVKVETIIKKAEEGKTTTEIAEELDIPERKATNKKKNTTKKKKEEKVEEPKEESKKDESKEA